MENLFYILVPIAYFIYQVYTNYQKEQEKAKKRNLGVPQAEQKVEVNQKVNQKPKAKTISDWVEEYKKVVLEEVKPSQRVEPAMPKVEVVEKQVYVNKELNRNIEIHKKINQSNPKEILLENTDNKNVVEQPVFDLRDAIIKEAILKRPYS